MVSCFVKGCKNKNTKENRKKGITFHKFPKKMEQEWLAAIGKDKENVFLIQQRICSIHFLEESFIATKCKKFLKPGAIPSRHLHLQELSVEDERTEGYGEVQKEIDNSLVMSNEEVTYETVTSVEASTSVSPSLLNGRAVKLMRQLNIHSKKHETSSSSTASTKRQKSRQIISLMHTYSKESLRFHLQKEHLKIITLSKRMKILKQKNRRLYRRVSHLKEVIVEVKQKYNISNSAIDSLESCFSTVPKSVMLRMLQNHKKGGKITTKLYPEELRRFALTLQFYSAKAYDYVRKVFNIALPAPSTIRRWLSVVNYLPGYSRQCLESLKIKAAQFQAKYSKPLLFALVMDEMSIKKELVYDKYSSRIYGFVDIGNNTATCYETEEASNVLVLMVVAVNDHFKMPFAYFFINRFTGDERANLVKEALHQLHSYNIQVISLTCDGPQVHFKMMASLGCSITSPQKLLTSFKHPVSDNAVHVMFDVCHMLKLIRNSWAISKVFFDENKNEINWKYIEKLHEIQDTEGLHLANKLKKKHLQWKTCIMKVNVAAQTLSQSVADALRFLKEDLQLEEFENVEGTVIFLEKVNKLFDIFNSRNPFGKGMKTPLRLENEFYWRPFLEDCQRYLLHLKDRQGTPLYLTRKRVPFLGFLVNINSMLNIYDENVVGKKFLKYILTYKFSQDHLELFFCSIRSRNGWNNNPNCLQFIRSYKRLLLQHNIKSESGSCLPQDQTYILPIIGKNYIDTNDIHLESIRRQEIITTLEEQLQILLPIELNEYSENVVVYICGFTVKMVEKVVHCITCAQSLRCTSHDELDFPFSLIRRKSRGKLIFPSYSLCKIGKKVESRIQQVIKLHSVPPPKDIFITILLKDVRSMVEDNNLFPELQEHFIYDISPTEISHKKKMIENIIKCYSTVRLYSIVNKINETISGEKIRNKFNKLILFKHQ